MLKCNLPSFQFTPPNQRWKIVNRYYENDKTANLSELPHGSVGVSPDTKFGWTVVTVLLFPGMLQFVVTAGRCAASKSDKILPMLTQKRKATDTSAARLPVWNTPCQYSYK